MRDIHAHTHGIYEYIMEGAGQSADRVDGEEVSCVFDDDTNFHRSVRARSQLNSMYAENRRLQDIKDTLLAKVYRNVTLKKGAVLTFMIAQFTGLGKWRRRRRRRRRVCLCLFYASSVPCFAGSGLYKLTQI